MKSVQEIIIKLNLDELNLVISSLSQMPFKDVYTLIGKLNKQANEQIVNK